MAKSTILIRKSLFPSTTRRHISSSSRRSSTSPQRYKPAAAPAVAQYLKPFSDIPGPIALPMLRHSAHVLPRIGNFHHTVGLGLLEGLRDKYGNLVRLAKASRTRPVLFVFDPEMMREVYESNVTEPPRWKRSPLSEHRIAASSCPITGDETKAIWIAIQTLLQDGALLECYDKVFDEISAEATRRLGALRHAENSLNDELETEIYRWALETIGMMMFGMRLGCLDGETHVPTTENRSSDKISMDDDSPSVCSLSKRSLQELTPAERLVRTSREIADNSYLVRSEKTLKTDSETFNNALKAFDRQISLTEHFLTQALKNLNSGVLKPEQVLLNKLRPLDMRILPIASDMLLAGIGPLVHTAISMFYQLSLHAAQQQRAHDEVAWSAASKDAGAGSPELPYVAACTREALRLHPATGGVVRRSSDSLSVAGYEIPAGVDIVLAHGVTSKSDKQWGRAKAFIPERWCSEGWEPLRASKAHPLASFPFGEACPATGVVGKMLGSLATRVLDKYRLEWHGPAPNMATTGVNRLQPPFYFVLQNAA
ncbi:probable cytochrome P450 49a1 [Achroia grisella]|uniref:probable cytochrome P450 49a1 n=1 Tax=Achroia grisella TaxID=688607 RepID=UPI0027D2268C|nr:probable cytochrome P450 49a1 [Achroia grisella]